MALQSRQMKDNTWESDSNQNKNKKNKISFREFWEKQNSRSIYWEERSLIIEQSLPKSTQTKMILKKSRNSQVKMKVSGVLQIIQWQRIAGKEIWCSLKNLAGKISKSLNVTLTQAQRNHNREQDPNIDHKFLLNLNTRWHLLKMLLKGLTFRVLQALGTWKVQIIKTSLI